MRLAGSPVLAVLFWLIAAPSSSRLASAQQAAPKPCDQPGDADQVAAVRAMADE